jgi:hypothetical protein
MDYLKRIWPLTGYQTTAFFLAAAVILTIALQAAYAPGGYNANLQNFFDALAQALGFFLAIFVFLVAQAKIGTNVSFSEKMFYGLIAWGLVLFAFIGLFITGDAKWTRVRNNVCSPLWQGSVFAVPLLLWGYFPLLR